MIRFSYVLDGRLYICISERFREFLCEWKSELYEASCLLGMKGAVFVSLDINYEMKIIMQKYLSESVCGIVLR